MDAIEAKIKPKNVKCINEIIEAKAKIPIAINAVYLKFNVF